MHPKIYYDSLSLLVLEVSKKKGVRTYTRKAGTDSYVLPIL